MSRWTVDEMYALARTGFNKCDLLGLRGTTLVSCEELAAMAAVLGLSGALSEPNTTNPVFKSRRAQK